MSLVNHLGRTGCWAKRASVVKRKIVCYTTESRHRIKIQGGLGTRASWHRPHIAPSSSPTPSGWAYQTRCCDLRRCYTPASAAIRPFGRRLGRRASQSCTSSGPSPATALCQRLGSTATSCTSVCLRTGSMVTHPRFRLLTIAHTQQHAAAQDTRTNRESASTHTRFRHSARSRRPESRPGRRSTGRQDARHSASVRRSARRSGTRHRLRSSPNPSTRACGLHTIVMSL